MMVFTKCVSKINLHFMYLWCRFQEQGTILKYSNLRKIVQYAGNDSMNSLKSY